MGREQGTPVASLSKGWWLVKETMGKIGSARREVRARRGQRQQVGCLPFYWWAQADSKPWMRMWCDPWENRICLRAFEASRQSLIKHELRVWDPRRATLQLFPFPAPNPTPTWCGFVVSVDFFYYYNKISYTNGYEIGGPFIRQN